MKKRILSDYDIAANKLVARSMRWCFVLTALMAIVNFLGFFAIDDVVMYTSLAVTSVVFGMPTIFVNVLKLKQIWLPYYILFSLVAMTGFLYALLSYHVVLLFALPVMMSCLYTDKKYSVFTTILTLPVIIVSHLAALELKIVPDEPLTSIEKVLLYGVLPRLIEFLGVALVCVIVADRTQNIIKEIVNYASRLTRNKSGLNSAIVKSDELFAARSCKDVTNTSMTAVNTVVISLSGNAATEIKGYSGMLCGDKTFYAVNEKLETPAANSVNISADKAEFLLNGKVITFVYADSDWLKAPFYGDDFTLMMFYNDRTPIGFIVLGTVVSADDNVLRRVLQIMYNNIETAIINVLLNNDMLNTQKQLVYSFAEISESKSQQTGQHIKRVSEYMRVIGDALGLSEEESENLSIASMLHDVGKLSISPDILEKPARLTDSEFEIIKKHVLTGSTLLENCPGNIMQLACAIAHDHHEKWDGTGYLGKKGDEINFYARYVAVIDVFDALVSKRSYKKAWTVDAAYNEIVSQSGKHFDPMAVKLFKDNFDKILEILRSYPDAEEETA